VFARLLFMKVAMKSGLQASSSRPWKPHDREVTYLAPPRVNLALMEERWPDVKFRATREHH